MLNIINGNIFETSCNLIIHQVNAQGVMRVGIAKEIKEQMTSEDFEKYKNFVLENKEKSMGCVIFGKRKNTENQYFAHCIGQYNYGRTKGVIYTDYSALEECFKEISTIARKMNFSVAIPYGIGCGLARGDWNIVSKLIEQFIPNAYIYKFEK